MEVLFFSWDGKGLFGWIDPELALEGGLMSSCNCVKVSAPSRVFVVKRLH